MASHWSFYKIVLFNNKCNNPRLRIPQKIVEKYESQLSDPVKLMVPTGGIWKVGLKKKVDDKTVWLHGDGLLEFVQKNSIKVGYFLLFKYGGKSSNFNVQIFDLSAMEIENYYHPNPSLRGESFDLDQQWNPPPSFEVAMKLRHIKTSLLVRVPSGFSSLHLLQPLKAIKMVDANGNEWNVGLVHNALSGTFISRGWSSFVRAKELKVGNICTFQLLIHTNKEIKLRVNVFQGNED